MLSANERRTIIDLIHREVVPAIGCTEPIAVALCTARTRELLDAEPQRIRVLLSANILKNAMGVGIPGTGGMIGLPIAVALGALVGRSAYKLEVLRDATPEAVERGKRFIAEDRIEIRLKENIAEKLYIEVEMEAGERSARAVIAGGHTDFVYEERNGEVRLDCRKAGAEETAECAFRGDYGHSLGKTLCREKERRMLGDAPYSRILSYTAAACDARMAGAMIPVMSNSGSGNQGITATLPVVVYAEECGATEEQTIRALILSHLTVIYIKQSLGRLSALCGCVVAATGSSCGMTWLMGGGYDEVAYAVKNMIANLTGMICDGAKPSCALKLASGVSTAVLSAMLAMEHRCVSSVEGIIDDDVDRSIRNLTRIGRDGMNETDSLILNIMTHKGC